MNNKIVLIFCLSFMLWGMFCSIGDDSNPAGLDYVNDQGYFQKEIETKVINGSYIDTIYRIRKKQYFRNVRPVIIGSWEGIQANAILKFTIDTASILADIDSQTIQKISLKMRPDTLSTESGTPLSAFLRIADWNSDSARYTLDSATMISDDTVDILVNDSGMLSWDINIDAFYEAVEEYGSQISFFMDFNGDSSYSIQRLSFNQEESMEPKLILDNTLTKDDSLKLTVHTTVIDSTVRGFPNQLLSLVEDRIVVSLNLERFYDSIPVSGVMTNVLSEFFVPRSTLKHELTSGFFYFNTQAGFSIDDEDLFVNNTTSDSFHVDSSASFQMILTPFFQEIQNMRVTAEEAMPENLHLIFRIKGHNNRFVTCSLTDSINLSLTYSTEKDTDE